MPERLRPLAWPFEEHTSFDHPPASLESTPRTRRPGLHRALQETTALSSETVRMSDIERRPRATLLSPINRRRQRSPTDEGTISPTDEILEEVFGEAVRAASSEPARTRRAREFKRRRIERENDDGYLSKTPIKYGYYGQVEPGRLKLDLVSCDGGEHVDPRHPDLYLGAKNLLAHNKSVYCSERPTSNIIFRHADDTPFCLEKLHIVGPEHGFTAPVREGVVYVGMDFGDVGKYLGSERDSIRAPHHFRYDSLGQGQQSTARDRRMPDWDRPRRHINLLESLRTSPERLSLSDALRDSEIDAELERRERDVEARDIEPRIPPAHFEQDFGCEIPVNSDSLEDENVPVMVLSDEDVGPEESSSQEVLDFRLRRLRLMQRRREMELDRYAGGLNGLRFDANDDTHPTADAVVKRTESDLPATDETVTAARFSIKDGKHKVAIRFEPAISGRFILLKVWSGRGNVDVQSVIAKGYGGPRFFPAREMV